ncbi:MAG TPA: isoprenylcysteine carboxylmethyltransferase family protein [Casimicrobiaceae bacterium]
MPRPYALPPVYFLAAIILMALLDRVLPMWRWHWAPGRWLGAALVVAGLALTIASARLFRHRKTAIKPFAQSSVLVVEGPYRASRNPMYVGLCTVLAGIGLLLESFAPLVVIPIFVWIIRTRFVAAEEQMLEQQFGSAYAAYRARVRRWL